MPRHPSLNVPLCAVLAVLVVLSVSNWSTHFSPAGDGGQTRGVPRVRLPLARRDLGTIAAGSLLRASFQIDNEGTRRLVVRPETGRCCGQSGTEEVTIVPSGRHARLMVELETAGMVGGLQREFHFATNDPKTPRFTLTVIAHVMGKDQ